MNVSTGHEKRVSCEQIAQLRDRKVPQTVTEIFSPFPPAAHAWTADSADLPPLRSPFANSRSIIASATSIVLFPTLSQIFSVDKWENVQKSNFSVLFCGPLDGQAQIMVHWTKAEEEARQNERMLRLSQDTGTE